MCVFLSAFVLRLVNLFLTCTYIAYSFSIWHFATLTIFVRNQELIVLKQVLVKVCNLCDFLILWTLIFYLYSINQRACKLRWTSITYVTCYERWLAASLVRAQYMHNSVVTERVWPLYPFPFLIFAVLGFSCSYNLLYKLYSFCHWFLRFFKALQLSKDWPWST